MEDDGLLQSAFFLRGSPVVRWPYPGCLCSGKQSRTALSQDSVILARRCVIASFPNSHSS